MANVRILATRTCHHRPYLEKELSRRGIPYEVVYTDERPDLVARYHIRHSPVLLVDDEVVFMGMPEGKALEAWIAQYRSGSFKQR
ncbi:glutaredoxin family protein [Rhodothermus marinus]|jgi:glutaredoxin|uniref:glutaredoxin family protein n=1 Tax=Rhodothermus marinus TaxID=29549 RepID=UPI0012BA4EAE|nr:thioredoxin family protein [Rhodothermus marinus]BBM71644.1 hypothetical protein RmaAA338_05090 [Rhodothermus marinus]